MSAHLTTRGALYAFVIKEVRHLARDRQTLVILLLLPVVQLLLFGFAVRTDIDAVRVIVVSPVPDAATAALRNRFAHSGRFELLPPMAQAAAVDGLLKRGDADVAVILEPGLRHNLRSASPASILVVTDASDPNTSTTMQAYALAIVRDWQRHVGASGTAVRIEPRVRMRFNPTLESVNLFVPGLIALILTLVASLMSALSLSREKEQGTMELLLVSALRPWQIIVGKVIPYLGLAMANVLTVLVAARAIFGVPFNGSYALLFAASTLFALVSLALGVLIAALTTSQLAATLAALGGTMLPSTMLSGLIFPIESMPRPLQWLTAMVPARWFVDIIRGIMLKGVGLDVLWSHLLILTVMLALLLSAAIRRTSARLS